MEYDSPPFVPLKPPDTSCAVITATDETIAAITIAYTVHLVLQIKERTR